MPSRYAHLGFGIVRLLPAAPALGRDSPAMPALDRRGRDPGFGCSSAGPAPAGRRCRRASGGVGRDPEAGDAPWGASDWPRKCDRRGVRAAPASTPCGRVGPGGDRQPRRGASRTRLRGRPRSASAAGGCSSVPLLGPAAAAPRTGRPPRGTSSGTDAVGRRPGATAPGLLPAGLDRHVPLLLGQRGDPGGLAEEGQALLDLGVAGGEGAAAGLRAEPGVDDLGLDREVDEAAVGVLVVGLLEVLGGRVLGGLLDELEELVADLGRDREVSRRPWGGGRASRRRS